MQTPIYFHFSEYLSFYFGFVVLVLGMLALDLGVFHRKAHEVSVKEASIWTAVWISLALIFNVVLYFYTYWKLSSDGTSLLPEGLTAASEAKRIGLEFLTGFVVEKSLAIDNIFVFAVVFSYFAIPKIYQHRVLFWGVIGALVFRGIFIAMGSVLMQFHGVILFFGGLLILTGVKMFFAGTEQKDLGDQWALKLLNRFIPVHPKIEGDRFLIVKDGKRLATPLLMALIVLEFTDIVFAVDSVPAIFALTKEPFIVFTSNIFAILGLRSMYFMLAGVMDQFAYIKYGLAAVLIFVGLKMVWLNEVFDGKFPITWSLLIIAILIGSSVVASLVLHRKRG